jgi:hypothetical protein
MNGKESGKVSGNDPENNAEGGAACDWARAQLSLLLYGELSFDEEEKLEAHLSACTQCREELDRETRLHAAFDSVAVDPAASLLSRCRQDLWSQLKELPPAERLAAALPERVPQRIPEKTDKMWWGHELWDRFVDALTLHAPPGSAGRWMRPIGALALVAIGFFGARLAPALVPMGGASPFGEMSLMEPGSAHVRSVETGAGGQVQLVVDETHQRVVSGRLDDRKIRSLLLAAATDPSDPGLRTETLDILTAVLDPSQADRVPAADVRDTLVFALRHDQNAGVRLKAMEGLKPLARDPEVRAAMASALLNDANPGVRTLAIDALTAGPGLSVDRNIVGTLQELMLHENNAYVRDRGRLVLESLKASPETY